MTADGAICGHFCSAALSDLRDFEVPVFRPEINTVSLLGIETGEAGESNGTFICV